MPTADDSAADADLVAVLATKDDELTRELQTLTARTDDPGGISFGKRVGDGTSVAVERLSQVAAYERLQVMLADVRRAQAKLAEGSYGECDECGARIHPDRLDALPWATHCITCASSR